MSSYKPSTTSIDTTSKLGDLVTSPMSDSSFYCSLAGAMQYLSFFRPDITELLILAFICLHPLLYPSWHTLMLIGVGVSGHTSFDVWLMCLAIVSSLKDNLISWSARFQTTLSRSSAEAEYVSDGCEGGFRNLLATKFTPRISLPGSHCYSCLL
ncbi:uncharacterized mitochondrial protein AtMg00810-like [Impatiens glandulifera]|uniref:uncharacterized mitochondrial protein AtMg00810-like n=1 Tax=Impatiens glandulifera TaxID=253017 RepID=UPI001FB0B91B|nr:uncharacterized mitochondrial protein AtMg00810-like [Impatiens glandulifera]